METQGKVNRLQSLIENIANPETPWETKLEASDAIVKDFGRSAVSALLDCLGSANASSRNASALALREIKDNEAVNPLFRAIKNPRNEADHSTLVYALEMLDCKEHFLEVISLALSSKADVRISASIIFFEQGFLVDDDDVATAKQLIQNASLEDDYRASLLSRLSDFE